jgi:hypothetical protein
VQPDATPTATAVPIVATPTPTYVPPIEKPIAPDISFTFQCQFGVTGSWAPATHSLGIDHYHVIITSNGLSIFDSTTTATTIDAIITMPVGNYMVGISAVTSNGIEGDFKYSIVSITQADLIYDFTFKWSIRSRDVNGSYTDVQCIKNKYLFYSKANNAFAHYTDCTTTQSGYQVTITCPYLGYKANCCDYRYNLPDYISRLSDGWVVYSGIMSQEVGFCGEWDTSIF